MPSSVCLNALKDLCARIEIVTSPKSRPTRNSNDVENREVFPPLRAEAEELITRLGFHPESIIRQDRPALKSLNTVSQNLSQLHYTVPKTKSIGTLSNVVLFNKENKSMESRSNVVLDKEETKYTTTIGKATKKSTALIIARNELLNSAIDSIQTLNDNSSNSSPYFRVPKHDTKRKFIRPRAHIPLPAASFLEANNEIDNKALIATIPRIPFDKRPEPLSSQYQPFSKNDSRTNQSTVYINVDSKESDYFNKRLYQRRRYSLPTVMTSTRSIEDDCSKKDNTSSAITMAIIPHNVLLHPLDVANALLSSSNSSSGKRPPLSNFRQQSNSDIGYGNGQTQTIPKMRLKLGEWIKSQKTEKDRHEAGFAAAIRLCDLHRKRRVFSRFFIILQRNVRCRQLEKRSTWLLMSQTFFQWKSALSYWKWLQSLDDRSQKQAALRILYKWKNAVIQVSESRTKNAIYTHAMQCFKSSVALSKWRDTVSRRRGSLKLTVISNRIRQSLFFISWQKFTKLCAKRNAAGLIFNKMRIRALVLPRLFRQWQRFVVLRTRVKAAEANMIILCKRRVFRTVISKFVLRHVTISNFSQVNGSLHRIHRSLRKWRLYVCEKKRIVTIMTSIQQLDVRASMRTLIKRWKINSMTSRSLKLKESEVKALHDYRKMCRAIVLWKERTNEIRSFRNNFQIADLFRVRKIKKQIFESLKNRTAFFVQRRIRTVYACNKMLEFKARRALKWWRFERNLRARNVAVEEMIQKRNSLCLQSYFNVWVNHWANESEVNHKLDVLASSHYRTRCLFAGVKAFREKCALARYLRLQWNRATVHHGFSVVSRSFRAIREFSLQVRKLRVAEVAFTALAPQLHISSSFRIWKQKIRHAINTRRALHRVLLSTRLRFLSKGLMRFRAACIEEEHLDIQNETALRFRKTRIMKAWSAIATIKGTIRRNGEMATVLSNRRRARIALSMWNKKTLLSLEENMRVENATSHYENRTRLLALTRWKMNTLIQNKTRTKYAFADNFKVIHSLKVVFNKWKGQYKASALIRTSVNKMSCHIKYKVATRFFNAWKSVTLLDRSKKQGFAISFSSIFERVVLRRAFASWAQSAWFSRIKMLQIRQVQEEVFRKLQQYGRIRSSRRRQSEYLSIALSSGDPRILCWARLVALHFHSVSGISQELETKVNQQKHVAYGSAFKCFKAWSLWAKQGRQRRINRLASETAAREYLVYFSALKGLIRWRSKTRELCLDRLGNEMALSFRDSNCLHRAINSWKEFTITSAASVRIAQRNLLNKCLFRTFRAWARYTNKIKRENSLFPLKNAFKTWLTNSRAQRLLRVWRTAEHKNQNQRTSAYPQRSIGASEAVRLAFSDWVRDDVILNQEK
jgi:hypothetical protein